MSDGAVELVNTPRRPSNIVPDSPTASNGLNGSGDAADDDSGTLPPVDGGKSAWSFLLAAFLVEALLWGFPSTFGVFQAYYSGLSDFQDSNYIAVIGTVSTSIFYLGAPVITPLCKRYHHWQRIMIVMGWMTCVVALLGASFVGSIPALIATQGALYGTGFLLLYHPILSMLNEWFVKRRGLAYGVLYGGAGLSGIGLPFLLEALLSRYGYRITLRAVAITMFVLIGPLLPLVKGRLPPSRHGGSQRRSDISFFSKPLFYCFALSNLFQGLSFFIPAIYLPSFASLLGYTRSKGAVLLAANNLAQVFGQVAFGYVSDRLDNVLILVFASSFIAAVAAFLLWGLARSLAPLLIFSLIYGWFAGGYVVLWPKFGTALGDDPQTIFSVLAFEKGLGNCLTGPISAALLRKPVASGYGMGKYEPLILFLGSSMLCSSLGILGWPLRTRQLRT